LGNIIKKTEISESNGFSDKKKCWMGLGFTHWELIGWLWFAIGGRLIPPSRH